MTVQDTPTPRRYTVREAAKVLGIGTDAVRKRIARGTISYEKDDAGRVYVYLDAGQDKGHDDLWCPLAGSSQASAWSSMMKTTSIFAGPVSTGATFSADLVRSYLPLLVIEEGSDLNLGGFYVRNVRSDPPTS
jgi:excisionase family DNA binding protein